MQSLHIDFISCERLLHLVIFYFSCMFRIFLLNRAPVPLCGHGLHDLRVDVTTTATTTTVLVRTHAHELIKCDRNLNVCGRSHATRRGTRETRHENMRAPDDSINVQTNPTAGGSYVFFNPIYFPSPFFSPSYYYGGP